MERDEIELLVDEIPDYDLTKADYQVWAVGYTLEGNVLDYENLLASFKDPDKAIEYVKQLDVEDVTRDIPEEVEVLVIQVETVVEIEGIDQNVGVLFEEDICLK